MFSVGEHVVHPGQGVCTVVGFEEGDAPMIVLEAKAGHALTRMLYPAAMADRLHACVSGEEAGRIIEGYAAMEVDEFRDRNGSLEESYFKKRIKLGAPTTVQVAKTMRSRIAEAEGRGKKPSSYYLRILKEAHRRAAEELTVALGCTEEELDARFVAVGWSPLS